MFSFTLLVKSDGYKRSRNTRLFLCAACLDESGHEALDPSFESAINSSYVFTGIDKDLLGEFRSFINFTSDSAPARLHEIIRGDARELMSYIHEKSVEYDPE